MNEFLRTISEHVAQSPVPPEDHLLIFPSARSLSTFETEYVGGSTASGWLPVTNTLAQWITELSDWQIVDSRTLLLDFTHFLLQQHGNSEDLKTINSWGNGLLSDFNSILIQEVDLDDFFKEFFNIKIIEQWNLEDDQGLMAKQYVEFWKRARGYLLSFYSHCKELKRGSLAMAVNGLLSEQSESSLSTKMTGSNFNVIHFVGFSALSNQERRLIKSLAKSFELLFWHERLPTALDSFPAQKFALQNGKDFGKFEKLHQNGELPSTCAVWSCNGPIDQVVNLQQILREIPQEEHHKTVIFLSDPGIFPILINHFGDSGLEFNSGIGYPCSSFRSFSIISSVISETNLEKGWWERQCELLFRTEMDLFSLEKHSGLFSDLKNWCRSSEILSGVRLGQLLGILENLTEGAVFKDPNEQSVFLKLLSTISAFATEIEGREIELVHLPVRNWLLAELNSSTITLRGDKQKGIQILSPLEGRNLNFEHVIYLSFNQEHFEFQYSGSIPLELRLKYKLPGIEERNASVSYQIYRSMSGAKTVNLLFDATEQGVSTGEPASIIYQLDHLLGKVEYRGTQYGSSRITGAGVEVIEKTPEVLEQIRTYLTKKGLSPSALNTYLKNPMDFYLANVLGFQEMDKTELIDPSIVGSLFHKVLEEHFRKHGSDPNDLSSLSNEKLIMNEIELTFEKLLDKEQKSDPEGQLLKPVIKKWVQRFLETDLTRLEKGVSILEYEKELDAHFEFEVQKDQLLKVRCKGFIDRVERLENGCINIVDYKTGKVTPGDLRVNSDFLIDPNEKKSKALQLLFYAWLYHKGCPERDVVASIYSCRNHYAGFIPLEVDKKPMLEKATFSQFELGLKSVILEMMDPTIPIVRKKHEFEKVLPY